MTLTDLRVRVSVESGAATAALALAALALAGVPAGLGILGAGALTIVNFWWLTRAAVRLGPVGSARPPVAAWSVAVGARFLTLLAALGVLLASGWAHPVAVVVGVTVLPCDLVVQGLRGAREGR